MRKFWILLVFLFTACSAPTSSPVTTPTAIPTTPPPATPASTDPVVTPGSIAQPGDDITNTTLGAMAASAAQTLNVPVDQVKLLSLEPHEWPDGCLGLAVEGEICTQAIVPGFLATFDTPKGKVYFHTNQEMSYYRMAKTPPVTSSGAEDVLIWKRSGGIAGICEELHIRSDGSYTFVTCTGAALSQGSLAAADWAYVQKQIRRFATFDWTYELPAGAADMFQDSYSLSGHGTEIPLPEEQVKLNDWLGQLAIRLKNQPTSPQGSRPLCSTTTGV